MSQLRHPHVVQFLGVCYLPGSPIPVLLMEKLQTILDKLLETSPNIPLDIKVHLLMGTSQGLVYLHGHTPPIIHQNLTARHILIDSGLTPKITGLGSIATSIDPDETEVMPGSPLFTAPEMLYGYMYDRNSRCKLSSAIDIFSFGVVTLFVLTQTFPSDLQSPTYLDHKTQKIVGRTETERREQYIHSIKTSLGEMHPLVQMCLNCLENRPEKRPSAIELLRQLKDVQATLPKSSTQNKLELIRRLAQKEEENRRLVLQDTEQKHQLEHLPKQEGKVRPVNDV